MSTEYTLPPVPDHPEPRHMRWSELERKAIADYGLICSYKAREPLLAEIDRLRAEVEALRAALTECADELEAEVNARASGEQPRRIERDLEPVRKARALLAQPAGTWVNPLAAEVEALRAAQAQAKGE